MKIAALIARILLGLVFVVFGLNGFLNFMKGPLPSGVAGQFLGALMQSHFVLVDICGGTRGWCAPAGESLRAAGARTSWPRDREHLLLSSAHGPQRPDHRHRRHHSVGTHRPSSPPILLRPIRPARFVTDALSLAAAPDSQYHRDPKTKRKIIGST